MKTKTATIRIAETTTVRQGDGPAVAVVDPGKYRVTMPADYDPRLVTAEDMVLDGAISYQRV